MSPVIVGTGWASCIAAVMARRKAGAKVIVAVKIVMILSPRIVGCTMRNAVPLLSPKSPGLQEDDAVSDSKDGNAALRAQPTILRVVID